MRELNPPELRKLTPDDLEAFWQVRLRALKEEPESFGASYEESKETSLTDAGERLRALDDSFVLGAFSPHLIGLVGLYRKQGLKVRHQAVIWGMYVVPEWRGQGIARRLIMEVLKLAKTACLEDILITVVTTQNVARSLYLSVGFKPYGVERRALKIDGRYFDEEHMALELNRSF